jgi:hypothetical protein
VKELRTLKTLLFVILNLAVPGHIMAQRSEPEPGFLYFFNMRFSINYPNDWNIIENLPSSVHFTAPDITSGVVVNWGYPPPSWILDKNAWLENMTKQGIIVNRIDNETTIANNTGLLISFTNNNMKYSVALAKVNDTVFDFVYFTRVNDFPTYLDKANTMLDSFHINSAVRTFQDYKNGNTLFRNWSWWSIWKRGEEGPPGEL